MSLQKIVSLSIPVDPIHYDLRIGEELFEHSDFKLFCNSLGSRILWIADPIFETQARHLIQSLQMDAELIVLPFKTSFKTREAKDWIEDQLVHKKVSRDGVLIAMGGGGILDLVGFVAATYCRGIPYVSIPTTLLAMTDAAIGGKTAIDLKEAKNWIGAMHHPARVYIDLRFIRSLSEREFFSGLAETVKHSLIANKELFEFLEKQEPGTLQQNGPQLLYLIEESCKIKKTIVEADSFERKGIRQLLNFGHTVGHALETLSNYSQKHGEAIALGMEIEAYMSKEKGDLDEESFRRIKDLLKRFSYPRDFLSQISSAEIMEQICLDKKNVRKTTYFVSLKAIGEASLSLMDFQLLNKGLNHALCNY